MKICSYQKMSEHGLYTRMGIILNDRLIVDPNLVWQAYFETQGFHNSKDRAQNACPSLLSDYLKLIDGPIYQLQDSLLIYEQLIKDGVLFTREKSALAFPLLTTSLTKPLDKIGTYRDFYTHEKHVITGFKKRGEELPKDWYEMPVYYKGATAGFIGPGEEILWPSFTDKLDYELELAAVIGKDAYNIKEKDAYKHIFGFTILNDVSARDIQRREIAIRLGPSKGKDFCSVIGPVIVTADEFNYEEPNLLMTAKINGEEWSRGQSGDSHFSFAQMMEFAGRDEWLLATDLIGSGTVGTGCGLELDKWVKENDFVELTVEKIGTLKNKVGEKRK